ncbi:LCP family protein [Nonomuraea sp. NPDC050556]|uniref:LCP family protein n=1 Tax=Nonomuraea sp. NPDC050556 TaxID=3364369 RepID=UPI00378A786D
MARRTERVGTGAVLGWTLLSVMVPGAAHLRAGWRKTGLALLGAYAAMLLGILALYLVYGVALVGTITASATWVNVVIAVTILLGLAWFALVVHSFMVMRPGALPQNGQILTGTLAGLMAVVVLAPFAYATQFLVSTQSLVGSVFRETGEEVEAGEKPRTEADPWAGRPRVNIMLIGGDADEHRPSVRTDSMNVASIDVATGNTVLISLPRNLEYVRFRPDTPMAQKFPDGFRLPPDPGGGRSDLLNSVWEYADAHPELFGGRKNMGSKVLADTIGYTLGLKIDWYALVNMWGFARLIDAIGGVTITVEQDIVFGKYNEGLVKAGTRKLGGADAMWYSRSRTNSDDYTRMRRQKCVIGALLDQADPATVLTRFTAIAGATKELIKTDIPRPMLKPLVPLALKVKNAKVTSVQFVPPLIKTYAPDWEKIRTITAKALSDSVTKRPLAASATPDPTKSPKPSATRSTSPVKGLTEGCGTL